MIVSFVKKGVELIYKTDGHGVLAEPSGIYFLIVNRQISNIQLDSEAVRTKAIETC